jgi:hypothetical protein
MDDRSFDALVKAVASGASRRSLLKGMLGLGGAALTGGALLEGGADAAPLLRQLRCDVRGNRPHSTGNVPAQRGSASADPIAVTQPPSERPIANAATTLAVSGIATARSFVVPTHGRFALDRVATLTASVVRKRTSVVEQERLIATASLLLWVLAATTVIAPWSARPAGRVSIIFVSRLRAATARPARMANASGASKRDMPAAITTMSVSNVALPSNAVPISTATFTFASRVRSKGGCRAGSHPVSKVLATGPTVVVRHAAPTPTAALVRCVSREDVAIARKWGSNASAALAVNVVAVKTAVPISTATSTCASRAKLRERCRAVRRHVPTTQSTAAVRHVPRRATAALASHAARVPASLVRQLDWSASAELAGNAAAVATAARTSTATSSCVSHASKLGWFGAESRRATTGTAVANHNAVTARPERLI